MKYRLLKATAFAAALAGSLPAQAETVEAVVRTGDLDLASERGAAELAARVGRAAWRVCGGTDPFDMLPRNAVDQCARRLAGSYRPAIRELVLAARSPESKVRIAAAGPVLRLHSR